MKIERMLTIIGYWTLDSRRETRKTQPNDFTMARKMSEVLYFSNQKEFIDWLENHHQTTNEIWVGFFKKKVIKLVLLGLSMWIALLPLVG